MYNIKWIIGIIFILFMGLINSVTLAQDPSTGDSSTGNEFKNFDKQFEGEFNFEDESGTGDTTSGTGDTGNNDGKSGDWGYNNDDEVKVVESGTNYLVLETPIIKDGEGNNIQNYNVTFANTGIDQADITNIREKEVTGLTSDDPQIRIEDLEPDTKYYFVFEPVNENGVAGEPSKEYVFSTNAHSSADLTVEDISYSVETGGNVNLTWTPVEGIDKLQINLKKTSQDSYERIGEVDNQEGSYDFKVVESGDYNVKVIPMDSNGNRLGDEQILTMKDIEVEEGKADVEKTPEVGPELNILISILVILSIGYIIYRYRNLQQ